MNFSIGNTLSNRNTQSSRNTVLKTALTLTLFIGAPFARGDDWDLPTEKPGPQAEIFLSSLFANSASEGSFGLRGAFHLSQRWALEGSISRIDDSRVDLWIVDTSAKLYLKYRGRSRLYLAGGPGLYYSNDLDVDELMLHLGFGAEFTLGKKLYLRPEIRGRFLAKDTDANFGELALGLGWRF